MVSGDNELISPFQLPNFKFKTQIQNLEMAISNNPLNKTTARPLHYAKVAMGSWKQEFFIFERAIYLEYLDTDKMGGKVEKSI